MVHRVFRLSISPERAPEVRRVVDFDGRATLHDVHEVIQRELQLDNDHLYAFYLSGQYFDPRSEHGPTESSPHDSQRSTLFRLGLEPGRRIAYLFDFGDELRHAVTVVSVTDVEAPLSQPTLVESVGQAPPQYGSEDDDWEPYALPEHLTEVAPLAEAVLDLSERLDELYADDDAEPAPADEAGPPEAVVALLRELSTAALALAGALEQDEEAVHELDEWSGRRELLPRLLELPLGLVNVGELDRALAVARAFEFAAAEPTAADIAIIFAESGKRDEAVAQLESNLKQFPESWLTVVKSGEALEVLGDQVGAEASYRRAIELAEDEAEREEAAAQLAGLLEDLGRFEESEALLSGSFEPEPSVSAKAPGDAVGLASVGRNDPCPCGSGKKYKKCHGA
jgi:Plasmid pRiA4b ORF-3-like protein/SEC-C motif/Tetratrico peptide repeat